ncbi:hypothetical protein HGRIS_008203 [Hohenbuehelia grisea]|uniref:Uncharacterized protein n=1 Tax=Hohenbuehelia grisea TaxID=104357 RepID=A0ABR3J7S4_9AGAR
MAKAEPTTPVSYALNTPSPSSSRSQAPLRNANGGLHVGSPTATRKSPLNPDSPARQSPRTPQSKRRSAQGTDSSPLHEKVDSQTRRRRISAAALASRGRANTGDVFGAFSDEYELAQEDPQLLLDVQRALKLKAKREARARAGLPITSQRSPLSVSSGSSPATSHSSRQPFPSYSPSKAEHSPPNSKLDFSSPPVTPPRISSSSARALVLHPVPYSPDGGSTLDWGGEEPADEKSERRWTLSITKKKGKDKVTDIDPASLQKREDKHAVKLSSMRSDASAKTLQSAELLRNQFERKYRLVYDALESDSGPLNPAQVARWFNACEPRYQEFLDKSYPRMPNERFRNPNIRQPWRLSASVFEEYYNAHRFRPGMATIPEDMPGFKALNAYMPESPSLRPVIPRFQGQEDRISFEALNGSLRNSLDVQSRQSADSVYSGISALSNRHPPPVSPSPSFRRVRDFAGQGHESDHRSDGGRSQRNSASLSDGPLRSPIKLAFRSRSGGADSRVDMHVDVRDSVSREPSEAGDGPSPASRPLSDRNITGLTVKHEERGDASTSVRPSVSPQPDRRRVRVSLQQPEPSHKPPEISEQDEKKLQREYDRKHKLLVEVNAQNSRIRSILNRTSTVVREHDHLLGDLSNRLGIPRQAIEQEIIEAFGHDPAAVTNSTRRLQGWRAVEDIHERVHRQRILLRRYLSGAHEEQLQGSDEALGVPIASLLSSLTMLSAQHEELQVKAHEVGKVLNQVKSLHTEVKSEYNEALAHTSIVYPELSHIVALEESYKDRYQQFWEFGMDTLTFLLDQITPFWRVYGKTIGIDVQDFLIIPLYRNEFTGEPKRYPIHRVPRRSFRHWVGLFVFFCLSASTCILQGRAAVTSSRNFRLQAITHSGVRWMAMPFFWIAIVIQWSAFFVELGIVLVQLAVVAWWLGWLVKIYN